MKSVSESETANLDTEWEARAANKPWGRGVPIAYRQGVQAVRQTVNGVPSQPGCVRPGSSWLTKGTIT